jgi:dTDP-4-amino-4,6-dideoxygalactose transaminase
LLYENMSKIEEFNLHRKKISKIYFNNLSNIGDIILPEGKDVHI